MPPEIDDVDLVRCVLTARRNGFMSIVYCDHHQFYISNNHIHPFEHRERITREKLAALIAPFLIARKPAQSELGENTEGKRRAK